MKKSIVVSLFMIAMLAAGAAAQTALCPSIYIHAPTDDVPAGDPITASVNVSGGDPSVSPTYHWSVSAGTIRGGQGTPSITIDTNALGGESVTATVEIGGLAPSCGRTKSVTTYVKKAAPPAVRLDEFGVLDDKQQQARMDKMVLKLLQDPTATLYIIYYDGRKHTVGEAEAAALKAFEYIKNKKLVPNDVLTGSGDYREKLSIEFFIGTAGSAPPKATPTVKESDTEKLTAKPQPKAKP